MDYTKFTNIKVNDTTITASEDITSEELLKFLAEYYDDLTKATEIKMILDIKHCRPEVKIEAIKYSLTREDLRDPCMSLNIINLCKIYNTMDSSFFTSPHVYVNSIEELLDVKLALHKELKDFETKLSIYFISLFKSYNKINYEPLDEHITLPELYKNIIRSTDMLTLSGIFSISNTFDTSKCVYIDDANVLLTELLAKSAMSTQLMEMFLKDHQECQ